MGGSSDVVTGAFGYTGAAIARRLIASGKRVRTLTNHPNRNSPLASEIEIAPLNFKSASNLRRYLEGADVLYNTYWIRFEHGEETFEGAVENSRRLIEAAKAAGVRRIVHVSICNPDENSPLPYYSGKARVEKAIRASGLSYAILRPTVIFGDGGILMNNIAWFLRKFPVFAVPGGCESRMQPVFLEDFAELAIRLAGRTDNIAIDAVGPEQFAFEELARLIAKAVKSRAIIFHANRAVLRPMLWTLDVLTGDTVLTREELDGLAANLLVSSAPPTCPTKFSEWLTENGASVGSTHISELAKHFSYANASTPCLPCGDAKSTAKNSPSAIAR